MVQAMPPDVLEAPTPARAGEGEVLQCLTFVLADEVFAMDIRTVREIIQHAPMTVVPLMPAFVRGVINLRGAVVPVIDLRSRFGRGCTSISKKSSVVIFDPRRHGAAQVLGLLVDAVSEVIDISPSAIEATPSFGTTIAREYLRGYGKVDADFIPIIDTERALDMDVMAALVDEHLLR
ncbi:MAG: chemotaxis protein CheW [Rhodoferax sp.]